MQRSSSSSLVGGEALKVINSQNLPTYDPLSHVAKKERSRLRSAENAVHLIPLVVLLCAAILWFFSTPVISIEHVKSMFKTVIPWIATKVKGLTIDGKRYMRSSYVAD